MSVPVPRLIRRSDEEVPFLANIGITGERFVTVIMKPAANSIPVTGGRHGLQSMFRMVPTAYLYKRCTFNVSTNKDEVTLAERVNDCTRGASAVITSTGTPPSLIGPTWCRIENEQNFVPLSCGKRQAPQPFLPRLIRLCV